ncbi:MAG TPA: NAD(P)H-dependent oxidoreductase subunit E [Bacteroidales bacterium]|nr:NAD(P)H-dependent oxidoreductase subunit E [Bacteroidales bacterium]HPB25668.1 NAD(P)H-dependent oxidoreductase subunit E [Bacteroidales bacterium]HPI30347.1 NAD(P)H-dependent oxidoreductase subunit E [Bacteroidales bacterium]HQN16304.1 NAD(P)H-dependent oxidoreductase subunit E [Bacteroidales bacterium]HQP16470.1 NAD(P)H-dependent oxidoreductase subunit E [Bacteroidales bacterium]
MKEKIISIVESYGKDAYRLMDILSCVQSEFGCVSGEAVGVIAEQLHISEVDVIQTRSFYHFYTCRPVGKYAVYLNNSVVSCMMGMADVADEFEKQLGIRFGESTTDELASLHYTACIGMSDQEPAAIINDVVFTSLTREKVKDIIAGMRAGKAVAEMVTEYGDGNNAHALIKAMVKNNIKKTGPVIFDAHQTGAGLAKALGMDPKSVIGEIKESNLRGRGGAGFPTGLKWDFCSRESGDKYVLCNADEGEPGTFKDRVLMTERSEMLFEGMAIGGYAIGAKEGILYVRKEYKYLKAFLENTLKEMYAKNLLGKNILGKGVDFDIRIQFGAGAYVCGEESGLIESCEGKRGEPRNRPPFPAQKGYKSKPSIVNNVETFCSVARILDKGGAWHNALGTKESSGTKVISVSGDCKTPGIYEIQWGMSIKEMLDMVGAEDVQAVQVAGPSGICLPPSQFDRKIALEDLPTGGSMIVIGKKRDLLKDVVLNFMEFFADESCGSCVTCRSFNMILKKAIEKVVEGHAVQKDVEDMLAWSEILRKTTRCGLGQTSSNPVATTIRNFKELYDARVHDQDFLSNFDMHKAVLESCEVVGREPKVHE